MQENGGYDEGYRACPCFWGKEPGSLIKKLVNRIGSVSGLGVLDVGCGEGKNAVYLGRLGANVVALDVSAAALQNATRAWPHLPNVAWRLADVRRYSAKPEAFDIVILYGVLHCLVSEEEIRDVVERLQSATTRGGYHLVCAFNDRRQDLAAHPGLTPTLLPHGRYLERYGADKAWRIIDESDSDLWEVHPHNRISHVHSMTRLMAIKELLADGS